MSKKKLICYMVSILFFMDFCDSQNPLINREPIVAGRFYALSANELQNDLQEMFSQAQTKECKNLRALIVPHAGYVFSGVVAATAYNQIDVKKKYDNIFLIGSSHTTLLQGASIYSKGNFKTPLGEVKVNLELAEKLIAENSCFEYDKKSQDKDHTLEVQLPFLQYLYGNNFRIVPIIIGTQKEQKCYEIAEALKPYFNENNLFIISSDFSHYPAYNDAIRADTLTLNAILTQSPEKFINQLRNNDSLNIKALATSACGWTSILTLLYLTQNNSSLNYKSLQYLNSGDNPEGSKSGVVGYHAIAVTEKEDSFSLTDYEKQWLLNAARTTLNEYTKNKKIPKIDTTGLTSGLKTNCGIFVSLHKNGNLRGCIGRFMPDEPLYRIVQEITIQSSNNDSRFNPVNENELKDIEIEISVLTPLKKISSIEELILGKHGIYIRKDFNSGTFLPQVATQTGWSKLEFIEHCSRDKARLGKDGWKTADLYVYEAIIFAEHE